MDREPSHHGNQPNSAEMHALRDANRASTQVPAQLLEKLKTLQTHPLPSTPEISVLKIPAVLEHSGSETPDDLATTRATIPWPSTQSQTVRSEPTPAATVSAPAGTAVAANKLTAPTAAAQAGGNAAGGSDRGTPSRVPGKFPPPAATSAAAPPAPSASVRRESSAPAMAWYQSIASNRDDRPIQEICQRLQQQFPRPVHAQLLFTSADPAISTNRTVGRIAANLAQATNDDILLVDANWDANLAIAKNRETPQLGLAEVLSQGFDWRPLVLATQTVGLRVLPCGAMDVPARQIDAGVLMKLAAEWRRDYAYVLINGGYVKQLLTRRMAVACDGAYLMVELNQTTKTDAAAASRILTENKARPMGAIVFDSAHDA